MMALPSSLVLSSRAPLSFIALDGVEDDVCVRDRLAVIGTNDGDGNCRGVSDVDFVFAAVVRVVVLGAQREAASDEAKCGENDAEKK